jgi:hypothetical protein
VECVQQAQWKGIRTATFVFSWDNLTSQGRIIPAYDHYIVWNDDLRRQLLDIYSFVRPEQVSITGTPQFDFHFRPEYQWTREQLCRRTGADPARPIVLYSTGMANHMPGEERLVEGIADRLATMRHFGPPQLMLRVYPKDLTGRFDGLRQRRRDILVPEIPWAAAHLTPKPDDLPLLTNMLRHCSIGINIASTMSLELCMFDKPVLNVAYDPPGMNTRFRRFYDFDHYAPVVASGAVELACSEEQLCQQIDSALRDPGRRSSERRLLVHRMFGDTLDGNCAERVAACLLQLLSREPRVKAAVV